MSIANSHRFPSTRDHVGPPCLHLIVHVASTTLWSLMCVSIVAGLGCDDNESSAVHDVAVAADVVVEAPGAGAIEFRDPVLAINGVRGAGSDVGSFDVFSLGTSTEPAAEADHYVTLAWSGRAVVDGPGADFTVFENPFAYELGRHHFVEPAIVELSRDGETWVAMPHDYQGPDETVYSDEPQHWQGFAGLQPVYLHEEDNPVDPMDAALAGGDQFDLADLPDDDGIANEIKRDGFLYVRLVTASTRMNIDTDMPFPTSLFAGGPDIDGVYARYVVLRDDSDE